MNRTQIGWTDFTSNPLRYRAADGRDVWACVKVSAGCTNCYAAELAKRYDRGGEFNAGVMATLTPRLDEQELHRLATSKLISGKRVFLADMTDLFGEWVPESVHINVFEVLRQRPDVTWQILTKRPERMARFMHEWLAGQPAPLNVWLGTSVENQAAAAERIPALLATPAAVRFISAEPLLGPLQLDLRGIDWVIVGGESGPGCRGCDPAWIADIVRQGAAAGIAVYVKQDAGSRPGRQGRLSDALWGMKQFPAAAERRSAVPV